MTEIYKVLRPAEWAAFQAEGVLAGTEVDVRDGFIHLSAAHQVEGTLARYYGGEAEVVILAVEAAKLGARLKWEASRGGEDFPHLYGVLSLAEVRDVTGPG